MTVLFFVKLGGCPHIIFCIVNRGMLVPSLNSFARPAIQQFTMFACLHISMVVLFFYCFSLLCQRGRKRNTNSVCNQQKRSLNPVHSSRGSLKIEQESIQVLFVHIICHYQKRKIEAKILHIASNKESQSYALSKGESQN